jgi:hypothetical protein
MVSNHLQPTTPAGMNPVSGWLFAFGRRRAVIDSTGCS